MTESLEALLTAAGWFILALSSFFCLPALVEIPRRKLEQTALQFPEPESWPPVSVIVAARDEQERIGATLRRLLASDYPALEVVLANDRSRDDTGRIAAEIAAADSRLKIITIATLPPGWLGKCHAMSSAAGLASGSYLLFTDGDVQFSPQAIRHSLRLVLGRQLDHFCLFPSMETHGWCERVLVSVFAMLFAFGAQPWFRRWRWPLSYYGIGAFNLVSRPAYDKIGGHEPIRMDVLDDVKLGKLLFRAGFPADYQAAGAHVSVRWQDSAWGVIRGLEKNAFASLHYSLPHLAGFTLLMLSIFVMPWIGAVLLTWPRSAGWIGALIILHLTCGRLSTALGGTWSVTPGLTFGALGVLLAFLRSTFLTLKRGGVRWRETFYPLNELRRGLY